MLLLTVHKTEKAKKCGYKLAQQKLSMITGYIFLMQLLSIDRS